MTNSSITMVEGCTLKKGIVVFDGRPLKWRQRPDGSIKVESGLGKDRKVVESYIEAWIKSEIAEPGSNLSFTQMMERVQGWVDASEAEVSKPTVVTAPNVFEKPQNWITTPEELKGDYQYEIFRSLIKNIIDNTDCQFGFMDQVLENHSKNLMKAAEGVKTLEDRGMIRIFKDSMTYLTEDGLKLAIELQFISGKKAAEMLPHVQPVVKP